VLFACTALLGSLGLWHGGYQLVRNYRRDRTYKQSLAAAHAKGDALEESLADAHAKIYSVSLAHSQTVVTQAKDREQDRYEVWLADPNRGQNIWQLWAQFGIGTEPTQEWWKENVESPPEA
jgi:hypothetical protein